MLLSLNIFWNQTFPKKVLIYRSRHNSQMGHWLISVDPCTSPLSRLSSMTLLQDESFLHELCIDSLSESLPTPGVSASGRKYFSTVVGGKGSSSGRKGIFHLFRHGVRTTGRRYTVSKVSIPKEVLYFHIAKRHSSVIFVLLNKEAVFSQRFIYLSFDLVNKY